MTGLFHCAVSGDLGFGLLQTRYSELQSGTFGGRGPVSRGANTKPGDEPQRRADCYWVSHSLFLSLW